MKAFLIRKETEFQPEKLTTEIAFNNGRAGSTRQSKTVRIKYDGFSKFGAMVEVTGISQFQEGDTPAVMCKAAVEGDYAMSDNNRLVRAWGIFMRDLSQEVIRRYVGQEWYKGEGPDNYGGIGFFVEADNNGEVKRKVPPKQRWNIGVENNTEYGTVSMRMKLGNKFSIIDARTKKPLTLDETKALTNPYKGVIVEGQRASRSMMNRAYTTPEGRVVNVDESMKPVVIPKIRAYVQYGVSGWFNKDLKGEFCCGLTSYCDSLELGITRSRFKWVPAILAAKYGPSSDDDDVLDVSLDWYKMMIYNYEVWKKKNVLRSNNSDAFASEMKIEESDFEEADYEPEPEAKRVKVEH